MKNLSKYLAVGVVSGLVSLFVGAALLYNADKPSQSQAQWIRPPVPVGPRGEIDGPVTISGTSSIVFAKNGTISSTLGGVDVSDTFAVSSTVTHSDAVNGTKVAYLGAVTSKTAGNANFKHTFFSGAGNGHGIPITHAGSIVGVGYRVRVEDYVAEGTLTLSVYKNNTEVWVATGDALTVSADGYYTISSTQARNADTLAAGDMIFLRVTRGGGSPDFGHSGQGVIEVYQDD